MANKTAARKARRETARKKKRRGSTSTASQGLVLRVIRDDPELQWMAGFVQQLGEKLFDVEHPWDLDRKQRVGWIKISYAIARTGKSLARDAGDYQGFLGLLGRIGEGEGEADLAQIEAELEAMEGGEDAKERREEEWHQAQMAAWETWQDNQRTLVRLVAFSVLFAAATITFGALTGKAVFIGVGVAGAMAVGLIKAVFSGSSNPFSTPWQSDPAREEGTAQKD